MCNAEQALKESRALNENLIRALNGHGWKSFLFMSEYYGSHSEYGEGDIHEDWLFHPSADWCQWEDTVFKHGHGSQYESNDAWEAWLEPLVEAGQAILLNYKTDS